MANMANWKNVNNWHWTEKNCYSWAKTYFSDTLPGTKVNDAAGNSVAITSVSECTGDVDLNQRKGKVITLYDLAIKLRFEGTTADDTAVAGTITIPELMHDTEEDEYVFDIAIDSETREMDPVKQLVRKSLTAELRKKLSCFARDLVEAHSKDVYIPPEQLGTAQAPRAVSSSTAATSTTTNTADSAARKTTAAGHFSTTDIKMSTEFVASARDVYEVLLNQDKVCAWTRSKASIRPEVGSDFNLFDGNITGTIVELVPDETIVMSWRLASWPANHLSNVAIKLAQGATSTEVKVTQRGVPLNLEETTRKNWQHYYWDSISRTFGYGTTL